MQCLLDLLKIFLPVVPNTVSIGMIRSHLANQADFGSNRLIDGDQMSYAGVCTLRCKLGLGYGR